MNKALENIGSFEITRYHFELVAGKPKIVIDMIKVLDKKGDYIKFARLRDVEKYLCRFPVSFKKQKLNGRDTSRLFG